jgi:hypothetical protein
LVETGCFQQLPRDRLVFGAFQFANVDLDHHVGQHIAPVEHDGFLENDADIGLRTIDAFAGHRDGP